MGNNVFLASENVQGLVGPTAWNADFTIFNYTLPADGNYLVLMYARYIGGGTPSWSNMSFRLLYTDGGSSLEMDPALTGDGTDDYGPSPASPAFATCFLHGDANTSLTVLLPNGSVTSSEDNVLSFSVSIIKLS